MMNKAVAEIYGLRLLMRKNGKLFTLIYCKATAEAVESPLKRRLRSLQEATVQDDHDANRGPHVKLTKDGEGVLKLAYGSDEGGDFTDKKNSARSILA